jgi:hypothetical protein
MELNYCNAACGGWSTVLAKKMMLICRHYNREATLAEINWRIRWDDILFGFPDRRKHEKSRQITINRVNFQEILF